MYKIGILEKDETYLWRLVGFLKEHHSGSFEINVTDGGFGLDAVDVGAVQYDALFLGDGVECENIKKELPPHTVVGYLTENAADSAQHISKYQSMEQIYKQMITLCESKKAPEEAAPTNVPKKEKEQAAEEKDGFSPRYVTVDGDTYRVYRIEDSQADRLAIRMLTGNRIKGLPQTEYKNGELRIRVTGMKSLCDYIRENNNPIGKERLLRFFAEMIATALSLEEYMLSMDKLLLNPKEIHVDEAQDRVVIPYMPLRNEENRDIRQCVGEIGKLCAALLSGLSEKDALPDEEEYGSTEEFDSLRKNAKESLGLKQQANAPNKEKTVTYIIRKRTGEKVVINRNLFKMGKDASYVDYCIKDNPAVSRNHADIVRKRDGFYLVDKGSLNHTFIDGRKLEAGEYRKLEDGCLLQLANDVFEFRSLTR